MKIDNYIGFDFKNKYHTFKTTETKIFIQTVHQDKLLEFEFKKSDFPNYYLGTFIVNNGVVVEPYDKEHQHDTSIKEGFFEPFIFDDYSDFDDDDDDDDGVSLELFEEKLFNEDGLFKYKFEYYYFRHYSLIAKVRGNRLELNKDKLKVKKGLEQRHYNQINFPCLLVDNFDESVIKVIMESLRTHDKITEETADIMIAHLTDNGVKTRTLRIV